jgi:hypothetical protein
MRLEKRRNCKKNQPDWKMRKRFKLRSNKSSLKEQRKKQKRNAMLLNLKKRNGLRNKSYLKFKQKSCSPPRRITKTSG